MDTVELATGRETADDEILKHPLASGTAQEKYSDQEKEVGQVDVYEADAHDQPSEPLHISLEERLFWAQRQRLHRYGMHSASDGASRADWMDRWFPCRFGPDTPDNPLMGHSSIEQAGGAEDKPALIIEEADQMDRLTEIQRDKAKARRAMRTASWAATFYLITTDVIGPMNSPYAISQTGLVGGILLYVAFGIAALYSSWIVLNLYLRLDSDRHPLRSMDDMLAVFVGKIGYHVVTATQIIQMIFIAASNTVANANSLTLLTANRSNGPLCYIICIAIWAIIGLVQSIPFLEFRRLSIICSANIFVTFTLLTVTMGFFAHSPPNFIAAAATYGYSGPPYAPIEVDDISSLPLAAQVNGAGNMIFGWSGIMVFVEFLGEMRRPHEFWKSFSAAEAFIGTVYIVYGTYVYCLQGQYTMPAAFQGVSPYVWQSVSVGLALWTYLMSSVLFLNVAVKIAYFWIVEDYFHGPVINSRKGWLLWSFMQTLAWALAFILAVAIPQVQTIQGLTAFVFLLHFSYTLPPAMQLMLDVQADASKLDGVFIPGEPPKRFDSWRSWARWRRGFFGGRRWPKVVNLIYCLAGCATCGVGFWGSIVSIIETFQTSAATSFGCTAPV